jgi:cyclase
MLSPLNRRNFLGTLAGLGLSRKVFGLQSSPPITATKLSDNLVHITGAGGNVVVLKEPDGLLLVNGGLAEHSANLMKLIAEHSGGQPVKALFNTDWHWENTGSNETLQKSGAKIIAHENTKLWLGTEINVEWQKRIYKPRPAAALPNQTFYTTGKMTFGKQEIQYGYLGQAHTDGDIYVFLPAQNVLITGDVFNAGAYPIPDYCSNGWLGGLVTATKTLAGLADANTRVIPGTGPVQTKSDLDAQFEMCSTMKTRLAEMMKLGKGANEIIASAPTAEFDKRWGDPSLFMSVVYRGLWSHVRELGGIV